MISEQRFGRLEDKVEKIDDKVDLLKTDISDLRMEVRVFTHEVKNHVAGDNKIILEILPVMQQLKAFLEQDMPKLKVIVREKDAEIVNEKKSVATKSKWKLNLTIVGATLSIVLTIYKMGLFKI